MKNFLFFSVVLVICLDGILLLAAPARHALLLNRWNQIMGISARVQVEQHRGLRFRLSGLAMIAISVYVIVAHFIYSK
jgi:hypothetical protein